MADKDVLGRFGEDLAAEHLRETGLTVLARNWRCRDGELDIVAVDGDVLVVCEVKTRSGLGYGLPVEAVTHVKARRIRRLAAAWLAEDARSWPQVRFDVVSVVRRRGQVPTLSHLRDAF